MIIKLPQRRFLKVALLVALAACVAALLWTLCHRPQPLPEFPSAIGDAPPYVLVLNRQAHPDLDGYPGRDFGYRLGEPVLVTLWLRPAQGSSVDLREILTMGDLKEVARSLKMRQDKLGKQVIQLELRLQCFEPKPAWNASIQCQYASEGAQPKVLRIPLAVHTSATYDGLKGAHPQEAPLIQRSIAPDAVLALSLVALGLLAFAACLKVIGGGKKRKTVQREKPSVPPTHHEQWLKMVAQAELFLAQIKSGQNSLYFCEQLAGLLRSWFKLEGVSADAIQPQSTPGVGTAGLAITIAICDRAVCSQRTPGASESEQLDTALKQLFEEGQRRLP